MPPSPIHPLPQWDIGHCYTWAVSVYGLDIYHINVLIIFLEVHVYILPNLLCNMNDNFQRQRKNLQRNNVQTVVAISVGTKNISVSSRINFANISYTKFNFLHILFEGSCDKKRVWCYNRHWFLSHCATLFCCDQFHKGKIIYF